MAMPRAIVGLGARQLARNTERKNHVFENRLPRQQLIEFLKYHHPVSARAFDLAAVDADDAFTRKQITTDRLEQGGLAATRGSEQHIAITALDPERDAMRRGYERGVLYRRV